jgi:hypothetical protein
MSRLQRYVPYMLLRTNRQEPDQAGYGQALSYAQFIIRHTSRLEAPRMDPWAYRCFLRYAFLVPEGTAEERALVAVGRGVAARLMEVEAARDPSQWTNHAASVIVGGLSGDDQIQRVWPGMPRELARAMQVCPDGFQAHNYHESVWEDIRATPIEFKPIPSDDVERLNSWLFALYKHSRDGEALWRELGSPDPSWTHGHSLVASGALEALENTALLFAAQAQGTLPLATE